MDGKKYLGVYIERYSASVVSLAQTAKEYKVVDFFSVTVDEKSDRADDNTGLTAELVNLIAEQCAKKALVYQDCQIAVALDCAMYMQHRIHSEFTDPRQIAQTVRFDTEESAATDISNDALAFEVSSKSRSGTELGVFTAQKKILLDILAAFNKHNIEPVTIEPDINCLSRFITRYLPSAQNQTTVCAILSGRNGYFIVPSSATDSSAVKRAFLISSTQDRNSLLTRQIALTTAAMDDENQNLFLKVFDAAGKVDTQNLSQKLRCQVENIDLTALIPAEPDVLSDSTDKVAFAAAAGAAVSLTDKTSVVDFRADFSSFQGKKQKIQQNVKVVGICAAICLLALGVFFQKKLFDANKPRNEIRAVFQNDYIDVLPGSKQLPAKFSEALRQLKKERDRLERYEKGRVNAEGEKTTSAKLTMTLEAFNKCAKKTDLQIDSINITSKYVRLTGSTSSYNSSMELRKALTESDLEILNEELFSKGGRHNFSITLDAK